jgi:hypothetical protein
LRSIRPVQSLIEYRVFAQTTTARNRGKCPNLPLDFPLPSCLAQIDPSRYVRTA